MTARIRLRTRLLPWLIGALVLLQGVVPYRGWLMLLVGLGGMGLLAYAWARSLAGGLRLTREVRFGWAQVGDRLEERFTLINSGWAPALWVEVRDHSTLPDYRVSRVTGLGGGSRARWLTRGHCTRRGLFTLGPSSLESGDPFGLFTVTLHSPASTPVMVAPPVVPLPMIEVAPGGRVGDGRPRPFAPERTLHSAGSRAYLPGDDLRWVHWPLSAHRNALFVRLFDGAPVGDWWILLDLEQAAQVGEGGAATEEHGVILAASLADQGLRTGRSVGLTLSGVAPAWLPPRPGATQRLAILRALALAEPDPQSLTNLLHGSRGALGHTHSLILITPAVEGAWLGALLPLMRRGTVPTVLLLEPRSFGGSHDSLALQTLLSEQGIRHHLIPRSLLERPEARPGHQGEWEWLVTPGGRALLKHAPGDLAWREL